MRNAKRKKRFPLYIACIAVFFAILSGVYLYTRSYTFYRASKDHLLRTETERRYVADQLENLQINLLRKTHGAESTGPEAEENLNRIDLRGVGPSPEPDRVFSGDDMRFTVIEN